ncbi:hypothetical protein ACLMJK_000902 [Lecanora helva]
MADVLPTGDEDPSTSKPRRIPQPLNSRLSPSQPVISAAPQSPSDGRKGHLNLDTFSPVNQNGSFAFDRVLKSGEVLKRTRKTKQWKPFYLVLRPNLLSLYKSSTEERLLKQISLSDLTAVAYLKDPKGRRQHVFGLFSPARNFHLQAKNDVEAQAWVELIKHEARIDKHEHELDIRSPTEQEVSLDQAGIEGLEHDRLGSSSPEPLEMAPRHSTTTRDGIRIPSIRRLSAHDLEYSGDEMAHNSDFSDTPPHSYTQAPSIGSFIERSYRASAKQSAPYAPHQQLGAAASASQASGFQVETDERVIWHGYLLYLKTKGGVRQWKRLWVVLRPKNLAFYKNEEEYAAHLIIPLSNIIDAVEIDPISRSKSHCMQVIAEDKSYRFCTSSEDALAEWLGALKSQLAKKKELNMRKQSQLPNP